MYTQNSNIHFQSARKLDVHSYQVQTHYPPFSFYRADVVIVVLSNDLQRNTITNSILQQVAENKLIVATEMEDLQKPFEMQPVLNLKPRVPIVPKYTWKYIHHMLFHSLQVISLQNKDKNCRKMTQH